MKEPKVVFCNAPWYDLNNKWYGIRAGSRWPFIIESPKLPENTIGGYNTYPFFMGYAVNYLTFIAGLKEVYFYDALALKHTYATFYGEIDKIKPDIVILETSTPSIENDLEIARNIKERGSEVALCGSHATVFAEELIKLPYIDYILQGEYEINSFEMCLMRKKGIYFCKPLVNIDRLSPARYAPYIYNYADGFGQDKYIEYPQLQMWTSRGCPYGCSFCLWRHTMTNGYYRTRNVDMVIRELTSCMKNFQFRSVLFDDDTFNIGDKRTIEISREMSKIDIQWHAMVRADSCSKKAFMEMRKAGCVGLKIGVETFSQRGLDYLNKGYKKQELIDTIDYLVDIGFKIFLSTMTNIPGETGEEKEEDKRLIKYFTDKGVSIQNPNCMPLPGTKIYSGLDNQKKIDKSDWKKYGCFHGETIL